jgi:hypothetical protein
MARKIKRREVPRQEELTPHAISHLVWLIAKCRVQEKRRRDQQEREKRQARKAVTS